MKRQYDRPDGAYLAGLKSAGLSYTQIAARIGTTPNTVIGAIDYHRRKQAAVQSPFTIARPAPLELTGDWVIVGDVHVPTTDWELAELVGLLAEKRGIRNLIIAGDLFNFDALSAYPKVETGYRLEQEFQAAEHLLARWCKTFTRIVVLMGNHDRRLQKALAGELNGERIMSMLNRKVEATEYGWCRIGNWRVTHSRSYSRNQLTVASELAIKHQCNVISHHEHHLAKGWDRFGRYVVMNGGGLFDPQKMGYVLLDDSTMPEMKPGFSILQNGVGEIYGKWPFTNWETLL